jgi:hypothetical protein
MIAAGALVGTLSPAHARQTPPDPDGAVDAAVRARVVDGAIERLKQTYVLPEVAEKMAAALRERMNRKEYDGITSARTFAETLTRNLQEVSHDKHLRVLYSAEPFPTRPEEPSPEERARGLAE